MSIDCKFLLERLQSRFVVISGGEPLYHQNFEELLERLLRDNFEVALETSGARAYPFERFPQVWVTFSPKLHATNYPKDQHSPTFWTNSHEIKVVIREASDWEAYEQLLNQAAQREIPICLQPEWSKQIEATPLILKILQQKPDWKISVQLHKYLRLP